MCFSLLFAFVLTDRQAFIFVFLDITFDFDLSKNGFFLSLSDKKNMFLTKSTSDDKWVFSLRKSLKF